MSGHKNIIFIIDSPFPFYAGGIETWLYNISLRLCKDNNVTIISQYKQVYKKPFFQTDPNIRIINYNTLYSYLFLRKILRSKLRIINYIGITKKIRQILSRLIKDNQEIYYVISLTTLFGASAARQIRRQNDNVRYICSARGPHAEILSGKFPLFRKWLFDMERMNFSQADLALSNGYDTIKYFERFGIKSFLMKNGVDTKKFACESPAPYEKEYAGDCFRILSVASLLDIKGIQEIIKALSILINKGYENICLILIGKGAQQKYKQQAKMLGVENNIIFLGHKTNVIPYMQHSDVICCLSGGSGLSMSALESMASSKPIVAWDTPVYQQFNLNCRTMVLAKEKDADNLADKLEQIMLNPDNYKEMSMNARQESFKYDWDEALTDFTIYLEKL